jgi:hypothetical protein
MPVFKVGASQTTTTGTVEVTVTPTAPLPPGTHRFQLVVVDDSGNQSDPVTTDVVIKDTIKPVAQIKPVDTIQPGQTFSLDGSGSTDTLPGKVVQWIWTMLS